MLYLQLFWEFFKTGLFAIGGGMATLPFLYAISDNTGWFTHAQLADMIAVSESTPGAIGVNMATYVGFTTTGILGSIVAVVGLVLPSIIIILVIAKFLESFQQNPLVKGAFYALRPASVGLIAAAGLSVIKISILQIDMFQLSGKLLDIIHWPSLLLAAALWLLLEKCKVHPILIIAIAAVVGMIFKFAGA